jgi:hypothetical protein
MMNGTEGGMHVVVIVAVIYLLSWEILNPDFVTY